MHHALLIDEILEIILDKCRDWPDTEYYGTVAQLARCCKAWKDPALDRVWKNLAKVDPLLALVGDGEEIGNHNGCQELSKLSECHPFLEYSSRVKSIVLQDRAPLVRVDHEFILPRVASITLGQDACKTPAAWIASPSLKELHVKTGSLRNTPSAISRADALAKTIERIAQTAHSSLTFMKLRGFMTPLLNRAVSSLTTLRTLSIYGGKGLDVGLLSKITTMPHLQELAIHAAHIDAEEFKNAVHHSNAHRFPSLISLHVRGDPSFIQALIALAQLDTLEQVKLDTQASSEQSDWRSLLETITSKASTSLRALTIQHTIDIEDIDQDASQLRADDIPFTIDVLRPLSATRQLQSLTIDSTIPPTLTDRDIEQLASWWPHITTLDFGTIPDICDITRIWQPTMTAAGLIPLARNCTQLHTLTLPLNLSSTAEPTTAKDQTSKPTVINNVLRNLRFGYIGETKTFAPFIRQVVSIFPEVDTIECTTVDGSHPVDVKDSIYGGEDRNTGTADGLADEQ